MDGDALSKLYFAYGSNMSPGQMAERCPGARMVSTGVLAGYRVAFTRYSQRWDGYVADVVRAEGDEAHGVLWAVSEAHLTALDVFEGVAAGGYRREDVMVRTPDGVMHAAVAYVVVEPGAEGEPSGAYREVITAAARLHGLPTPWERDRT
ncbi:MAG TPA: gamma-glutamylcyclotransferase family protein [Tepidiformaceae bacterium]|nr:gamma-glutamylcyclotransferase family protein [Tepidiformaceae bacterium]